MIDKKILTTIVTAIGASLCCITPVLAVLAGSAGLASSFSWMEPFRPYLIAITLIVLAYAWWDKLKPATPEIECACDPDENGEVSFWYSKRFLAIITIFALLMLSFPYWGERFIESSKPKTVQTQNKHILKKVIAIEGMTCKACEATVSKVGGDVDGVVAIETSLEKKESIVSYDTRKTDINKVMQAIGTTGYRPVGYTDDKGYHKVNVKTAKPHIELQKGAQKCGGGKCGAGKCGASRCGSAK